MISLYRLALRLLPAELRRKHGAAMETLFARELQHARARGRRYEVLAAVMGVTDVLQRFVYERVRMRGNFMKDIPMGAPYMSLPTTRQLLRRHAFSFVAAFVVLTAILLVQYATRQVPSLSARGAGIGTIVQALALSLPFIAAMTLPMAVLISVLYEFTRLGANGTLAAAQRVPDGVRRLVVPVLAAAAGITVLAFVVTAEIVPRTNSELATVLAGHSTVTSDRSMTISELRDAAQKVGPASELGERSRVASYEVEIQKKVALPVACLLLAFAGITLAFRIPRGGATLVIAGSLVFFCAYYALLMTGETLAERTVISPFIGMWGANAFVFAIGMLAVWRRGSSNAAAHMFAEN